jgi:hypothetical protein
MSFDLSWLWNLLDSIADTLNSWFAGIWTQVSNIINTGQGIFGGLVAFGSQIWDALTKFAVYIGDALVNAYNYFKSGLENMASIFGEWLSGAFNFLSAGVSWIGSQLYNFGNWLYNGVLYVWNWLVNSLTALWDALTSWFAGISTAIGNWWASVTNSINAWWTDLLKGFRSKIVQTITADITISMAWKGAERILSPSKVSDIGYGLFGILTSPVIGRVVGEIVNAVVPMPSTSTYPLIPTIGGFTYTPPSLTIETPTEKTPPPPSVEGTPTYPFSGTSEKSLNLGGESYTLRTDAGQLLDRMILAESYVVFWLGYTANVTIGLSYALELLQVLQSLSVGLSYDTILQGVQDLNAEIGLTYETEITP